MSLSKTKCLILE
jgi:hypothetical protein